ncbi:MAG: RNA binding S1 domain protein [Parcubacteria group bacterium GW2011_GWA2_46_10]|nr:MAG: RNA binding S1 domain protein [Parcubacteria group bacterium GW2011_GWA2_46_10]
MRTSIKKQEGLEFQMLKTNPGLMPILREGELVSVILTEKANRAVYFDVSRIGTGVIYGIELINARSILKNLEIGDAVTAKVVLPENQDGFIELSLVEAGKQKAWQELKELKDTDQMIEAKVVGSNTGGLLLDVKGIQGFLPASQLSNENYPQSESGDRQVVTDELKKFIGQEIKVKIISLNPRTNKLIFSEREVGAENVKELLQKYKEGDVIQGIISGVADFGAFIKFADQPEIEGLIHISELSHNMLDNPKEVVSIGDMVQAKIVEIKEGRVSLSLRALQEDPWSKAGEKFKGGDKVKGTIYKLNPFGAFVKLSHDLMGLIHVSEFGSVEELKKNLEPGKEYNFNIESVKPEEKRIVLKLVGKESAPKLQKKDGEESV